MSEYENQNPDRITNNLERLLSEAAADRRAGLTTSDILNDPENRQKYLKNLFDNSNRTVLHLSPTTNTKKTNNL
ncbi:hypothetical protein [Bifidobacterium mongoliense]|uniref:hypothetical protein n=1 Tax=Bifidobacterium mongoliense TaxID=518643 RepID=UPI0026488AC2|nr:hypothetical protein [Bifidobacterium mongoliense]MDN6024642.1 hypothetical protein [Bifidobacterium mongoliense]